MSFFQLLIVVLETQLHEEINVALCHLCVKPTLRRERSNLKL